MSGGYRTCGIRAYISEWFAVTSAIQEGKLVRSMTMKGRVFDNGDDFWPSDERFHGQGIKLFLSAPYNDDWASKVCHLEGISYACGKIFIEAHVMPKTYDFDGQLVQDEPVQIRLSLSVDAFNAIQQQAYDAERRDHVLELDATLSGNSLPEARGTLGILALKELDLSERREFAVTAVRFMEVGQQDRSETR